MIKVAQKDDWKTEPMPSRNAAFHLKRNFSKEQMAALIKGNIPQEMEDKWFWYYEDGKLYAHRSWTGFCIYIIEFNMGTGVHTVTVNRNPEQYKCTDISEDIESLNHLLDWWSQPQYDYYHEWLSEIVNNLMNQSTPKTTLTIDGKVYPAIYFHKPEEPYGFLSNWWISPFVLKGMRFSSVEQYIMYMKCAFFDDTAAAKAVLATDDPSQQQLIARSVKGYNDVVWKGMRQVIAMRGLVEKFAQNPDLLKKLQDTGDSYLVECAVDDKAWACGISLHDNARFDIANWKGTNILGFALMEARTMLADADTGNAARHSIVLDRGDITKLDCDCIVNAANKSLLGGGGVDGAIHRAAGKKLLEECRTLHGCATGEAKITGGYDLKAKHIIHTVGPVYSATESDAVLLTNCYRNSLNLAKQHGIHSIAFPAISTGVYGYPIDDAAAVAIRTIHRWFDDNVDYDMTVILSCFNDATYNAYEHLLQ